MNGIFFNYLFRLLITVLITFHCFIFTATGSIIEKISYTYDDAGNRISRRYIITPQNSPQLIHSTDSINKNKSINNLDIKIYPNPIKDILTVEIFTLDDDTEVFINLFGINGTLIQNIHANSYKPFVKIDMSNYNSGLYLLQIITPNQEKQFKIIKQ